MNRCQECGETHRPLNNDGVCLYRAGCEHRTAAHEGEMRRLTAQMAQLDPLPCGHNGIEHARMRADLDEFWTRIQQGYGDTP